MRSLASLAVAAVALSAAPVAQSALLYGGGTETGSRFNPGAGVVTYMNCYTTLGEPWLNQLQLENVSVGIRRLAGSGGLLDVGLKIYAAEMTWDGGTGFGLGASTLIYSTASLGAGAATTTQIVNVGPITDVTLDLETGSNAGLGGWWIGVEFTGANANSTANGWRVVNAPTTGASVNGFAMYNVNGSGIFEAFFAFGNPPGSTPSRFMVNVEGTLVPTPGAIALIGLAGLVTRRRR